MIPEMGECELWDCVSSDDHNAVFDIFTEESKLVGERCRSGSATLKEKSTLTRFLVELGALGITVYEVEKEGYLQRSVKVSVPERRVKESLSWDSQSQPDRSGSVVKQATGKDMTSELSAVVDEHKDSDAGDSSDCGDIMDGNDDDDDDEIPVWMRDPPVVEQAKETSVNVPELPQRVIDPKDKLTCSKCPAIFHNPWDLDLHNLNSHRPKLKRRPKLESQACHCDICNTVLKRRYMLFHLFKVHDLAYEEAIKKIPGFNVGLSKRGTSQVCRSSAERNLCMSKCDLCDKVLTIRSMLMHLYKSHGLSYQDALEKTSKARNRANKSKISQKKSKQNKTRPNLRKKIVKAYQPKYAETVSPDLHNLEFHKEQKPKSKRRAIPNLRHKGIPYSSQTCHCDICNTTVKRRHILLHFFKVHDLVYEEAVKKIPGFRVESSKLSSRPRQKSIRMNCDLCDAEITPRSMLMHLYRCHGFSYRDAVRKTSEVKNGANKTRHALRMERQNGYQLRNSKGVSPARMEIREDRAQLEKGAKSKKRQNEQQRKEEKSRRGKSQPKEIGELKMKVAYIKLERIDGDILERYEIHDIEQNTECSDLRNIDNLQTTLPTSATTDVKQDMDRSQIPSEQDKDIRLGSEEDGHECEQTSELGEGDASIPDEQSGDIDSQQTALPTSATADVKQNLDGLKITSEQDKDIRVGPEEDGHESEQNSELGEGDAFTSDEESGEIDSQQTTLPTSAIADVLVQDKHISEIPCEQDNDIGLRTEEENGIECELNPDLGEGVASTYDEQSGRLITTALTDIINVDQNEKWQVTVDASETDLNNDRPSNMENKERSDIIDSDKVRDDVSLKEDVREVGHVSIKENGSSGSGKDSSLRNNTHLGEEENLDDREQTSSPIEGGQLLCNICGKGFNSESQVRDHLVTVHFQCTTCFKNFKHAASLRVHVRYHKNAAAGLIYTCSICRKSFLNKYVHANHVKTHSARKKECPICHLKYADARSLSIHINRKHTQKDKYPCDQCDRGFFHAYELTQHINRKHTKAKNWKCDDCGKGFSNQTDVNSHKRNVHIPSGQHLCELCGAAFKTKSNLTQHYLTAHTDSFKFTCDICGKNFKRSTHLNAHRKAHSNDRPFKCEVCGKGFKQRHKLNVHMDWHNDVRKFACTLCPKTFLTKGNLVKHQTVHTKMYKHSCDSCGRGFSDLSQLRLHLSRVHGIIVKSKITKGEREKNVQSKAKTPAIASTENQTNSGISAEIEPSTSTSTTENQSLSITGRIDMDGHVIDTETQVHNPAVLTVTSEASYGDDNLLATEALVAMMHSHGIQ